MADKENTQSDARPGRLLHGVLNKARRRLAASEIIRQLPVSFGWSFVFVAAMLMCDRAIGVPIPIWAYVIPVGVALLIAAMQLMRRWPTHHDAAVALDRATQSRDRLASALAVGNHELPPTTEDQVVTREALGEIIARQADTVATSLHHQLSHVVPMRVPVTRWAGMLVGAAALGAGVLYLPPIAWAKDAAAKETALAQTIEQVTQERAQLAESLDDLPPELQETEDPLLREQLDAVDALADQLSQPVDEGVDPDTTQQQLQNTRDEAARSLNELAETLEEQAAREQQALDELTEHFDGVERETLPDDIRELLDQLENQNFEYAADALDKLKQDAADMTPEQRREHLEALRKISEEIRQQTGDDAALQERAEELRDALREQGLRDEEIDELLNDNASNEEESLAPPSDSDGATDDKDNDAAPQDDTSQQLEEKGVDEESADQIAEDIEQLQRDRQAQEQSQRDAADVADALDETADEIEKTEQDNSEQDESANENDESSQQQNEDSNQAGDEGEQSGDQEQGDQQQGEAAQNEQSQDGQQQTQTSEESSESAAKPDDKGEQNAGDKSEDEQGDPQQGGDEEQTGEQTSGQEQEDQQGDQEAGQQQSEQEQSGEETAEQGSEQTGEQTGEQGEAADPEQTDGDQEGAAPESEQGQGTENEQASDEQGGDEEPGQSQQPQSEQEDGDDQEFISPTENDSNSEQPSSGGESPQADKPSDAMRELEERKQRSRQQRDQAKDVRERVRELAEDMTPEERQQWMDQWNRQQNTDPGDSPSGSPDGENDLPPQERRPMDDVQTEDLTTGESDDGGNTVGHLPGDDQTPPPAWEGDGSTATAQGRRDEARRVAERAVDQGRVPSRYHEFIRRYFDRLKNTDQSGGTKAPATPPPAKTP